MIRLSKFFKSYQYWLLLLTFLVPATSHGAPVNPAEAAAIADLWYAMELNSGYLEITEAEKAERFAFMGNHQVFYMVSQDKLQDVYPKGQRVLAYVVTYIPNGFVVVSGDDRIEPIMVCSAVSAFSWDHPEQNFLRSYLGVVMPALWQHMPAYTHKNWNMLRAKCAENRDIVTYDDVGRAVYVLWETALWGQSGYYNDTCQAHNGGNNVPTGCVATALAIKMKFHNWPPTGVGSHSYSDTWGAIQYDHDVNYGSQSYNWQSMPDTCLTSENSEVARIMYHAGVSVDMDYELAGSGANTLLAGPALNNHFRYRGTLSDTGGPAFHEGRLIASVVGKLPVQIGGWGHSVIVDGYRDDITNKFHINCGWNGTSNAWYRLDSLPSGGGTIRISNAYAQPTNWMYVRWDHSGTEDGRILYPYNTLSEGEAASVAGGEVLIRTGTYTGTGNVPITFDNQVAIRAYAGDVVIGENVWLKDYEAIRLRSGGDLKITP